MTFKPTIIHASHHFIIVDKAPGWLSIPGRDTADSRPVLHHWLEREMNQKIWVVHRLDAEVSGVILFARTAAAHKVACPWFENRKAHKTYEAWTDVKPELGLPPLLEWKCLLARGKRRAFEAPHGKESVTFARLAGEVTHKGETLWRWLLSPQTGRSHQLRFEMFRHKMPIFGDQLYGSTKTLAPDTIALRAIELDFRECPGATSMNLPSKFQAIDLKTYLTSRQS